jgi:lipid-A-disaccharide synthase-like uncharacterized protein
MLVDLANSVGGLLHQIFVQSIDGYVIIGFIGQALFTMRFIVQWLASEREGRSVIPLAFWFFSIAGAVLLFIYAIYRRDPVFIVGQGLGIFIYIRNLMLIAKAGKGTKEKNDG